MSFISANRYLTRAEMRVNAEYIADFFVVYGWTLNAIAAMLGNMETESTINPGIYQDLDATSTTNGFGLVQWTPNTKYKEWADANGFGGAYDDIVGQIFRIQYECENNIQWRKTLDYPMSFSEFAHSNASPEELAQVFLYNYERPADLDQPNRSTQARAWYTYLLSYIDPSEPAPTPTQKKGEMARLLFLYAGMRKR